MVILIMNHSKLFSIFCAFCAEIHTQFDISIRMLQSNNAKEYLSREFQTYLSQKRIFHQSFCVDTLTQNGDVE